MLTQPLIEITLLFSVRLDCCKSTFRTFTMLLASFRGRGAGIGGVVFAVVVIIDAAGVTLLLPL